MTGRIEDNDVQDEPIYSLTYMLLCCKHRWTFHQEAAEDCKIRWTFHQKAAKDQESRFEQIERVLQDHDRKRMIKEDRKRLPTLLELALKQRAQGMEMAERLERNKRKAATLGQSITKLNGPKSGVSCKNKRSNKRRKINFRKDELYAELISRQQTEREEYVRDFYEQL